MKKTVLITGASSGIGWSLTQKFLNENYIVIGGSRSGKIEGIANTDLYVVPLDVTDEKSIFEAGKSIRAQFSSIDLLINNAGVGLDLATFKPEMELLKATFETNVFGLIHFTESILDLIPAKGTIFTISSVMGMLNRESLLANATAYRMSKAAVNMYTKTLAARLADQNINVNAIHPGWVKTNMGGEGAAITPEFSANGIFQLYEKNIPTATFWDAEHQTQMNW